MTYKEALSELEIIKTGYGDDITSVEPEYSMVFDACDKADKYRWHDLRKNPSDLPNNDQVVICQHLPNIIKNKKELIIMHCFKDGKFIYNWDIDMDVHSETFGQRYFGDIIAWKEIEPLKMME